MTVEPPVFEDRRRIPDRRQHDRRAEDRTRFIRTAVAAAVAICGGLVIVYLFFAAIGAFDFKTAAAATVVAVVLAGVWLGGYWYRHRSTEPRSPATFERERRGF